VICIQVVEVGKHRKPKYRNMCMMDNDPVLNQMESSYFPSRKTKNRFTKLLTVEILWGSILMACFKLRLAGLKMILTLKKFV
jgi:hypothetical protein